MNDLTFFTDRREVLFLDALRLMDNEIKNALHKKYGTEITPQDFFDEYCELHIERFGEPFRI